MTSIQCDYSTLSTSYSNSEYGVGNFVSGLIENIDEEEASERSSDRSTSEETSPRINPPVDRFNLVYLVFGLVGLGTLLPWNFFITANDYWMYKFRNESGGTVNVAERTTLQAEFTSYIALAMNIPYTVFLIICAFFHNSIGRLFYVVASLVCTIVIFIVMTVLVLIDTDEWQDLFFSVVMVCVVLLGIVSAVLSAASMGISSILPPKYIHVMVLCQALAGITATVAQILSLVGHSNPTKSAFAYFVTADVVLIATLIGYLGIQKTEYFQYYQHCYEECSKPLQEISSADVKIDTSIIIVMKRIWPYGISILLCFLVSLGIFPGLAVLVSPVHTLNDDAWTGRLFLPVTCFTLFNFGDFFGRTYAGFFECERHSYKKRLLFFSVLRIAFIPLFLLCNAQPRYHLPVIFGDISYIIFMATLGFTNGFLVTVSVICGTKHVKIEMQETAGIILSTFLGSGLMFGSLLSYILIQIL